MSARYWTGPIIPPNTRQPCFSDGLLAEECEMCGSTVAVEVHHIRALRDLNVKGRREKPKWVQIMATRKRITLVVCRTYPTFEYALPPALPLLAGDQDGLRALRRATLDTAVRLRGVTVGKPDDDAVEDGRNSRRRSYRKVVRERPGFVPSALFHIIGNTVFLRLADVASGLPDYEEKILVSSMDSEPDSTGYSQRTCSKSFARSWRRR